MTQGHGVVVTYLNLKAVQLQLAHLYPPLSSVAAPDLLHLFQDGNHHNTPGTKRSMVTVQEYPLSYK